MNGAEEADLAALPAIPSEALHEEGHMARKRKPAARPRPREHQTVFPEDPPTRSGVASQIWGVEFGELWKPAPHDDDKRELPATRWFQQAADPRLHPDLLRHEMLLLALQRLETINPSAAWQFSQEYAGLTLTLETARVAGLSGPKLGELADVCLAQLRRQKVTANKRDQLEAPEALRAVVVIQYERALAAIQALQDETENLPREAQRARMSDRLNAILTWARRGREDGPVPGQLLDDAAAHKAHEVARALLRHVYAANKIAVNSLLKRARVYRENPLFRWLDKEIPPIP